MNILCFVSDLRRRRPWRLERAASGSSEKCLIRFYLYIVQASERSGGRIEHKTINTSGRSISREIDENTKLFPPPTHNRQNLSWKTQPSSNFLWPVSSGVEINVSVLGEKRVKATTNEMWITNPYIDECWTINIKDIRSLGQLNYVGSSELSSFFPFFFFFFIPLQLSLYMYDTQHSMECPKKFQSSCYLGTWLHYACWVLCRPCVMISIDSLSLFFPFICASSRFQ